MSRPLQLIRNVPRSECIWLCRDYLEGEVVYPYSHYIDHELRNIPHTGLPVAEIPNSATWFELPIDSLQPKETCQGH